MSIRENFDRYRTLWITAGVGGAVIITVLAGLGLAAVMGADNSSARSVAATSTPTPTSSTGETPVDNFGPEANPEAVARLEALGVRWPEEFVYQAWNEACTAPETAAVSIEVAAKLPEVIAYDEWVAARSDDSETWTDAEWAEHDALYETYEKAYDRQLIEIEEIVNLLREDCDAQ